MPVRIQLKRLSVLRAERRLLTRGEYQIRMKTFEEMIERLEMEKM